MLFHQILSTYHPDITSPLNDILEVTLAAYDSYHEFLGWLMNLETAPC